MALAGQRTGLIVALALAAAGCGEQKPDPEQREAVRVCREIADSFKEEREHGFGDISTISFFAPALVEQATRLERAAPAAATYRGAAEDLTAAVDERDLRGVRAAALTLQAASLPAAKAIGCELPPTARDVEALTVPFYAQVMLDSSNPVRAGTRQMTRPGRPFHRGLARARKGIGRALATLARHETPERLRRVAARYEASLRAYRRALDRTRRALLRGDTSQAELRRLGRAQDLAWQRVDAVVTDFIFAS